MPTGYTSELYEGKPQTFQQFALECARNFGAAIMQRDDAPGPVLKFVPPNTDYYDKSQAAAEAALEWFANASPDELAAKKAEEDAESEKRHQESVAKAEAQRERYEAMLVQVRAWTPPSPEHENLKQFMIDQLTESIDFDCKVYDHRSTRTVGQWMTASIADHKRSIEYAIENRTKELERAASRKAWMVTLAESLGIEVAEDATEVAA
jgi:hypothetical protein